MISANSSWSVVRSMRFFWVLFALFVCYATLIPFDVHPDRALISAKVATISWIPFIDHDGSRASIPDIVQNILLFLPFGFFGFLSITHSNSVRIALVTISGLLLSACVEMLQLTTVDRTTAATDLVTNTTGSLLGALMALACFQTISTAMQSNKLRALAEDKYFVLVLLTCLFVVIGAFQPFDFTLDVGSLGHKVKGLILNPVSFSSTLTDEPVVLFRFFLFAFVCSLWFRKTNRACFAAKGLLIALAIGLLLEGCQVLLRSRMPSAQDCLVVILGSCTGALFSELRNLRLSQTTWSLLIILVVWTTALTQVLSPFRLVKHFQGFNWIPFLGYYERTTFIALSNFIESALIYLPLGFIFYLLYMKEGRTFSFASVAVVVVLLASALEFLQGWVQGRYADVTDVLGALLGALTGWWAADQWLSAFSPASTTHGNRRQSPSRRM